MFKQSKTAQPKLEYTQFGNKKVMLRECLAIKKHH